MIEVSHLTKRYGSHTAVHDLSFTVESGQIYGLLGPNGAGKSTTMNIITGCLAATEGTVRIGGFDIFEQAGQAKRLVGYLPEQPPLYLDMTPQEYLRFVGQAKGVRAGDLAGQIDRAVAVTQIGDVRRRLIRNLSKGYRQRVGIAQALLGDPAVIILDEPTVGLDPLQIIEIRDLIKELGKTHTVILSSHILSEVRAVCGHVLIISKGRLVAADTPDNLEQLFAGAATLSLTVRAGAEEAGQALLPLAGPENLEITPREDGTLDITLRAADPSGLSERVFFTFADLRRPILRMQLAQASLEDVFIELTREAPGEAAAQTAETATQEEAPQDESHL